MGIEELKGQPEASMVLPEQSCSVCKPEYSIMFGRCHTVTMIGSSTVSMFPHSVKGTCNNNLPRQNAWAIQTL